MPKLALMNLKGFTSHRQKVYSLLDARLNSIRSLELALAINNLSSAAVQELKQLLLRFLPNGEQKA